MQNDALDQAQAVLDQEAARITRRELLLFAELLYLLEELAEDQAIALRIAAALMPIWPEARIGLGPA